MGEHVHVPAPRELAEMADVVTPDLLGRPLRPHARLLVDDHVEHLVHRAEEQIPGIRREQCRELVLTRADVVDLEPELDRQPPTFRLEDGVAVRVEVVDAAFDVVGEEPDAACLPEVVDMLREADLVDASLARPLDERLDGVDGEIERLRAGHAGTAKVHVVVDDHAAPSRRASTASRSARVVTLTSLASPSTTRTLPPARST